MSKLSNPMRKIGRRLINKFGKTVTFIHVTPATYNPATGVVEPITVTTDVKALISEYDESEFGELVFEGDRKLIVAARDLSSAPDPNDRVTIDGDEHQIVMVDRIVGVRPATYEIQVRR